MDEHCGLEESSGVKRGPDTRKFCLEVCGDYACFTRPETRQEGESYDFITPSAARGIFTSIFWKPAINWFITEIEVMNPIRFMAITRNEVKRLMSGRSDRIVVEKCHTQRTTRILVDVRYRIHAEFDFIPIERRGGGVKWERRPDDTPAKYASMFARRATKGQCHRTPFL